MKPITNPGNSGPENDGNDGLIPHSPAYQNWNLLIGWNLASYSGYLLGVESYYLY